MNKKRIVIVMGSLGIGGGAEKVISLIANHLCNLGWKVYILILLFDEVTVPLDDRVTVIDLSGNTPSRLRRVPMWLNGIRKIIKKVDPDCVLSFAARINLLTLIAACGYKKKVVVSERNDPSKDGRSFLIKIMTYLLYPRAAKVVLQTEHSAGFFPKRIQKNFIVIRNPVEVNAFALPFEERKKKIVAVGRFSRQKNHALLLRAFCKVSKLFPDYSLWIYGEGELQKEYEKFIAKNHLGKQVFLPGVKRDIHRQIADASIFVLSSDYEGLSNALLEALSMGLPCISTNCSGMEEIIENGVNGLLVDVGDENRMACVLKRCILDEELRKKIGKNARIRSAEFQVCNIINEWGRIIE